MALKATIFKLDLNVTDMDRNHYGSYALTLARHPSENNERMMVRLLAFAVNAADALEFTKGISSDDEPDLWQKSLSGEIDLWIDLGQPDEKRIRKACGRSRQVLIYTYHRRSADVWLKQITDKLKRFDNLTIINLPDGVSQQLATLAQRNMQLQCTIQDGIVWLSNHENNVEIALSEWQSEQ